MHLHSAIFIAGMPSFRLTEVAEMRWEALSFFLFAYLICGLLFKLLWNGVGKDWKNWPRLGYLSSLGVLVMAGLLCYVVLTMISGARELMTPGAWVKNGLVHKVADSPTNHESRKIRLRKIRDVLCKSAVINDWKFPSTANELPDLAEMLAATEEGPALKYLGPNSVVGDHPLVAEPGYLSPRYQLLTNGLIETVK